jgi:DNA modification methylase
VIDLTKGVSPLVLTGHVIDQLLTIPAGTVQVAVTSPPYWQLRDYSRCGCATTRHMSESALHGDGSMGRQPGGGNGSVDDPRTIKEPDPNCPDCHGTGVIVEAQVWGGEKDHAHQWEQSFCSCGSWRGSLGLEPTPGLYAQHLVDVAREVRRVLHPTGVFWINLGDTYNAGRNGGHPGGRGSMNEGRELEEFTTGKSGSNAPDLKPKDLVGIPWRVAFALQADGWWLRSAVVWAKPNPMPESITDRPTQAHEYVFLFAKDEHYFYDNNAVRNPLAESSESRIAQRSFWDQEGGEKDYGKGTNPNRSMRRSLENLATRSGYAPSTLRELKEGYDGQAIKNYEGTGAQNPSDTKRRIIAGANARIEAGLEGGANLRSWWLIPTQSFSGAHFATFPEEIPRRAILLSTSEKGACPKCLAPYERKIETISSPENLQRFEGFRPRWDTVYTTERSESDVDHSRPVSAIFNETLQKERRTVGWVPTCECNAGDPVPCIVLDPFAGSGTTLLVARSLGRRSIGIDLNPNYVEMAQERSSAKIRDITEWTEPANGEKA